MTGPDLRVDLCCLRASAPPFATLGDRLAATTAQLRSAIEAEGACWGTDEFGQQFVAGYAKASDAALAALPPLSDALTGIAEGLLAMAANHERNELSTKAMFEE